ncbi:MAG: Ig-like domain-containing protein [Holophagales bacterium]|nr:Ig-like domain-containing protein [Holophagales bacterium]
MRKQFCYLMAVIAALSLGLVSCGGGGGNNNNGGGQTVSVTGVSLNKNTMTLNAGSSETLSPTITPSNATNKGVTWTSSNDAIASVSGGRVTGVAQGETTITVRTNDGGHTATCSVTVNPATVPVTGVSLNKNTMTLTVGGTEQLTHTIQPPNATNQNVTWETSSSAVATVSNGIVTAIAQGSAAITVKTVDSNHTATCAVTVNPATVPVTGVSLNKNTMTLTVGGTEQLTHAIQPANATNQSVTWETSSSAVATVANGLVTAIAPGSATITVRTSDGNHTAICNVSVAPAPIAVSNITLNKNTMTLAAGDATGALVPTIAPINATNQIPKFRIF